MILIVCSSLSDLQQLCADAFLLPLDSSSLTNSGYIQFIVMLFPHPRSSRVFVRKTMAGIVGETGNIFAGEVEAFLAEEARARREDDTKVEVVGDKEDAGAGKVSLKERRVRNIAKRVIAVSVCFVFVFVGSKIDSERTLSTKDKVNVHSSDDKHRQGRTPALVRILIFSFLRVVFYKLMLSIVVLGLIINTKNCLYCSECT
jgi:hypothetical protein